MVGGYIVDYYTRKDGTTEFLVRGTQCESNDFCCVTAEVSHAITDEIEIGDSIWWQSDMVLLKIFKESDVPFKKIGSAGGGVRHFYTMKIEHGEG